MCFPAPNQEERTVMPDNLTPKDKLDYAYKWFEYHASQRLVAFNYLLVIMGALSVGYYRAFDGKEYIYALFVSGFGVFVALAFLVLDARNKDLVRKGSDALKHIENLPEFSALDDDKDPCRIMSSDSGRSTLKSHSFWLPAIEIGLLVLFVVATVMSGLKVAEERSPKKPGPKIETYYQCPTLNKTDATQFVREQNRRTQAS